MALGLVGDHHRQGGLARAWRSPQDDGGKQLVNLNRPAQQFARSQDVLLPDVLVQGARAHARRQRRFGFHPVLHGVGKKVHVPLSFKVRGSQSTIFNSASS